VRDNVLHRSRPGVVGLVRRLPAARGILGLRSVEGSRFAPERRPESNDSWMYTEQSMPFIPPMLCSRLENPTRLGDRRYIAEPKLDGQRAQVPHSRRPHCGLLQPSRARSAASSWHGMASDALVARARRGTPEAGRPQEIRALLKAALRKLERSR